MNRDQVLLRSMRRDADGLEQAAKAKGQEPPWLVGTLRRAISDLEQRIARGERNIRPEDLGA